MRAKAIAALHLGAERVISPGAFVPQGELTASEERALLRMGFLELVEDAEDAPVQGPVLAANLSVPLPVEEPIRVFAPAPDEPAETAEPPAPPPAPERMATIMEAMDLLEPEHFEADGQPKLADLSAVVGFEVTAHEAASAMAAKAATE